MTSAVNIEYPPIADTLYKAHSVSDIWSYAETLYNTQDLINSQYASKLLQCQLMLAPNNLKELEQNFSSFKEHLRVFSAKTKINMTLQRRQKDFLGINEKIRLYLKTGKNLSKINDVLGFRIILHSEVPDNEHSIRQCYQVLNETISFFLKDLKYFLLEPEPRSGTIVTKEIALKNRIFIAKQTDAIILHGFENNVKDYILNPKQNGYQSLHILFSNPSKHIIFEVQIRTTAMHILAEYGSCKHTIHKREKYEGIDLGYIDFTKINMPGFQVLPSGELYDMIGLQQPIDPFNYLYR